MRRPKRLQADPQRRRGEEGRGAGNSKKEDVKCCSSPQEGERRTPRENCNRRGAHSAQPAAGRPSWPDQCMCPKIFWSWYNRSVTDPISNKHTVLVTNWSLVMLGLSKNSFFNCSINCLASFDTHANATRTHTETQQRHKTHTHTHAHTQDDA